MQKHCPGCGTRKPLESFHKNRSTSDGYQVRCKDCRNAANAQWRHANPGLHKAANARWDAANIDRKRSAEKAWRQRNVEQERGADAERRRRRRARKRSASVGHIDLDELWRDSGGVCGICSRAIDPTHTHPDPSSKSLDHILPLSKGGSHAQVNVQWTHLRCNLRKGASLRENPVPVAGQTNSQEEKTR